MASPIKSDSSSCCKVAELNCSLAKGTCATYRHRFVRDRCGILHPTRLQESDVSGCPCSAADTGTLYEAHTLPDPRFFHRSGPFPLSYIARHIAAEPLDDTSGSMMIDD